MASAHYVRWFEELSVDDVPLVGGKNASLGEMYRQFSAQGVRVPNGFALTADSFRRSTYRRRRLGGVARFPG